VGLALYVILKIVAYVALCYGGVRQFRPTWRHPWQWAAGLGLFRFLMGLFAGLAIFMLSNNIYFANRQSSCRAVIAYVSIYVPARWIEWSIMSFIIVPGARRPVAAFAGATNQDRLWRLAGIAVSCLADIPVFMEVGGLPVGRFFC
jgi:hypothetical protein